MDQNLDVRPIVTADADTFIAREELKARVEARDPHLVLVDVLAPDSYLSAHIPGAINIPYVTMSERVVRGALPDPGADIVVYCGGGT